MSLKYLKDKLGDKKLPTTLGSEEEEFKIVEKEFGADKATFSLGAEAGIKVDLFNSADDVDEDKLFGNEETSLLQHQEGKSYLKYKSNVGIKLGSGLEIKNIGFSIDTHHEIVTSSYRLHSDNDRLGEAIASDMLDFKSIFSAAQIKSLEEGEALHLAFNGSLNGKVEASWADIFSGTLSELSGWLDNEALIIKVGAEASASFFIKVEDAFKLTLKKLRDDKFKFSITKNHQSIKGFSAAAGITIGFEDPDAVNTYVDTLVEGLFNENQDKIEEIIQEDLIGSLSKSQRDTLDTIAERLGWDLDENLLEKLKEEYDKITAKVLRKVKEIAEQSVKAGFSYDYKRIARTDTVFNAVFVGSAAIDEFHTDLLLMKVDRLIVAYYDGDNRMEEVTFLEKSVIEKTHSWGFSLGLGKWKATDTIDESIKVIKEANQDGSKVAYEAKKSFSNFLGQTGTSHRVDFNAAMDNYTPGYEPLASALDYSLFLDYTYTEKVLKRPELNQFLDLARIWQALPSADFKEVGDKVYSTIKDLKNITLKCELKFNPIAFESLVPVLNSLSNRTDIIASSLGKAMLYWEKYEVRKDPESRGRYYGPLWQFYFDNPDLSSGFYAEKARKVLKEVDKKLANWEYKYKKTPSAYYAFGSEITRNPGTLYNWQSFNEGIQLLSEGLKASSKLTHIKVVPVVFEAMQKFWKHPLHLKALGIYLVTISKQYPQVWQNINKTASITFEKEGQEQVIIIS